MNLQDQFSNFFSNRVVEMLASAVGLNPAQAQSALRAILPRQLDGLADLASNPQTAAGLGDLWNSSDLPHDPEQALATPDGLSRLETLGQGLSSRLFGGQASWLSDAAQHAGGNQSAVSRLSNLALPLLLSFLGRSGVNPQNAASQLTGMRGALSAMLPVAGVAAATGAVTEIVDSVAARPGVEVREGNPVAATVPTPKPAPAPEPERHLTAAPQEKSGFNPLWLLPLLLLGGLAWYLSQNRETPLPAPTTSQTTTSTTTTSSSTTSSTSTSAATTDEGIVVGNIEDGAQLPLEPFVLSGTAPANEVVTITNQAGETLGSANADENGKWEIQMPAPLAGANALTATGTPSNAVSKFTIEGVEGAAGTASGAAATSDAAVSGVTTSETTTTTTTTTTSSATASDAAAGATVTITEPASGASVGADSFNIVGKGQPNATYSLYEDGVNVGTFFADDTGAFTADVVAPKTGERNYILTDDKGNQVATLPLVVTEPVAAADCSANNVLTLSLSDGDTVSAPFRFGGLGSAKEYTVRVLRGDKQVGETVVPNGSNCAWSYMSDPGGEGSEVGEITYQVVPQGADKPDSTITLNVVQSGANFKDGQYVGPTN